MCFCLIIILSNPKIKQEIHIFFRIVLAGITMKNNEVIRRATKADYDDIISIIPSGEYDGDYLPDYFHILMDNPLCLHPQR